MLYNKSNDCRKADIWFIEIRTLTLPIIHINLISSQQRLFKVQSTLREFEFVKLHDTKTGYPDWDIPFLYGGEKEIRTLVGVLAQTRFPVVRLRPTQPSLRADPEILSQNYPFVKSFFLFCFKSSQNIPRSSPQTSFFFVFLLKSLDKKRKGRYNTLNR